MRDVDVNNNAAKKHKSDSQYEQLKEQAIGIIETLDVYELGFVVGQLKAYKGILDFEAGAEGYFDEA